MSRRVTFPSARRSLVVGVFSVAGAACHLGSYSLGVGPEQDGLETSGGGAAGSSTGGSGTGAAPANGGSAGNPAGTGGSGATPAGGTGSSGGSTGVNFGVLGHLSADGDGASYDASISADGRFVVYTTESRNFFYMDTNGLPDVLVHDRVTGVPIRMSVGDYELQSNGPSRRGAISADRSRIALLTSAENLGAPPGGRLGLMLSAEQPESLLSTAIGAWPVTPRDANGDVSSCFVSDDGSFLVFRSSASNLVPSDENGRDDFFVFEVATGVTERIVIAGDAPELVLDDDRPRVSADLGLIAFSGRLGAAPRNVYVVERATGATELVGVGPEGSPSSGECSSPSLTADGRFVAFACDGDDLVANDTNGVADVFVRDRVLGLTERVSVALDGAEADGPSAIPVISADGTRVVFQTTASNLSAGTPITTRYGALASHNRTTGKTYRFTNVGDEGANGRFEGLALSRDGRVLVFTSHATNMLPDEANALSDVYVHEFLDI
jgi:Tol biopolymer transport system component